MTQLPVPGMGDLPRLTVIVPACNEEATLERGLVSLLVMDYPELEFIVVNDRSTDRTGDILDRVAASDDRIRPVHLKTLERGWLGKCHALYHAAKQARGEFVLFTDADVRVHRGFLRQCLALMQANRLDHLTALPKLDSQDPFLSPVLGAFFLSFTLFTRPWTAKDPKSKNALGVGAFNLVRKSAYDTVGGHRPIRLRPDDDLALGRLMKKNGRRTDCINGFKNVEVEWYPKLWDLVKGLEKNSFAAFDYYAIAAVLGISLNFFFFTLPFVLPFFLEGLAQATAWAAAAVLLTNYTIHLRENGLPLWCIPCLPFAGLFLGMTLTRNVCLTLLRGGIEWRGTFYSLAELKSNRRDLA